MMIKEAFCYSYINAKVRSLKSSLLNPVDFENLLKVSDAHSMAEYLRARSFGESWNQIPASFEGLTRMYYEDLFRAYFKIIRMVSKSKRAKLVEHLYQRYELENLKLILRLIASEKPRKKWKHLLLPTQAPENFSVNQLLRARNLEEVIEQLKKTWYYEPLRNSLYRFEQEHETFPLEMALDLSYYSRLWKIVCSLNSGDRTITRKWLGVQFDILNISWIFRFKDIYHFSPEEILNYSLMHGAYLSAEARLKLAYAIDFRDMIANLKGTPYQDLLNEVSDPEICSAKLMAYEFSLAKKNWRSFPFQIGIILDYLLFKEFEIRDLVSITEAKKLNISHDKLREYLIFSYL